MKRLYTIIILFILIIIPLNTLAIFHTEDMTYFLKNKNTGEIKIVIDNRDLNEGMFSNAIVNYLEGKTFLDNKIFINWNFIEAKYYWRGKSSHVNKGTFNYSDLAKSTRYNKDEYKTLNNYIISGNNLSFKDLKIFTINDITFKEQIIIYYKYIFLNYLYEFLLFLPFNIVVFFFISRIIVLKILKKEYLKYIIFLSIGLYLLIDIILYIFGLGYSQVLGNLGGVIIYSLEIGVIKSIFFIIGLFSIINFYFKYRKTSKLSS